MQPHKPGKVADSLFITVSLKFIETGIPFVYSNEAIDCHYGNKWAYKKSVSNENTFLDVSSKGDFYVGECLCDFAGERDDF